MGKKFLIEGGVPLKGEVKISGYKNSAGAILAAVLLSEKKSIVENIPLCQDILDIIEILRAMGAKVNFLSKNTVEIEPKNLDPTKIPISLFERIRLSILLVPPLLKRFFKIKVPHPGGDRIGLRPISAHLDVFSQFGIKFEEEKGFYIFQLPKNFQGSKKIVLSEFSVTATENAIMLASFLKGETRIEIAASEPQVQDLCHFLKKMGVEISGIGTHTLEIRGRKKLKEANFKISPDPLEAGTFLIAFALTGGKGKIENVVENHLTMFLKKVKEIGVNFQIKKNSLFLFPSKRFLATKIQSLPYPGFPTDLQPQTSVLLTQAEGKSVVHEPLYENRFLHLHELRKMGADIEITDPHRALIFGKKNLKGTKLNASDIRAGAALVLAGLIGEGETEIDNIYQIERGFENFQEKLQNLGAKIKLKEI